jgi:hypothetical protein
VGPLLLIGWAEIGPGVPQTISGIRAVADDAPALPSSSSSTSGGRLRSVPAVHPGTGVDGTDDLLDRARAEDVRH